MAIYRGPYYSASSCTGSARPGARELMAWYLGAYESRGGANLGIYNCKALGSGVSIHGQGRACDLGTSPYNRPGAGWNAWGWALANALMRNSAELGIQLIIFNRKVWSCTQPDAGWRNYSGSNPHDGHMHVELIPSTAASLTRGRVESVLGGTSAPAMPAPRPSTPSTPTDWLQEVIMSLPTIRRGSKGAAVRRAQGLLHANGYTSSRIDGDYGPKTEGDMKRFQAKKKTRNSVRNGVGDGITGRYTWTDLLGA